MEIILEKQIKTPHPTDPEGEPTFEMEEVLRTTVPMETQRLPDCVLYGQEVYLFIDGEAGMIGQYELCETLIIPNNKSIIVPA